MLLHELFAKFHSADLLKDLRWLAVQCMAESNTRLPSSVTKPSNCNNLRILLVYSHHIDSRMFRGHLCQTYTVNTIFIDKHCCSLVLMLRLHRLEQSSFICTHC